GGRRFRRTQSDGYRVGDCGWIRLSRERRAISRRRLSRDALQLAMVPIFLMPFALIGGLGGWRIWHGLPAATRGFLWTGPRQHLVIATTNGDAEHVSQTLKS